MQRFRSMKTLQKIQLSSCPGPQPFQSGAPSRHPPGLQTKALRRVGRVERPRGLIAAWVCACCAQRRPPAVALTKPLRTNMRGRDPAELWRFCIQLADQEGPGEGSSPDGPTVRYAKPGLRPPQGQELQHQLLRRGAAADARLYQLLDGAGRAAARARSPAGPTAARTARRCDAGSATTRWGSRRSKMRCGLSAAVWLYSLKVRLHRPASAAP